MDQCLTPSRKGSRPSQLPHVRANAVVVLLSFPPLYLFGSRLAMASACGVNEPSVENNPEALLARIASPTTMGPGRSF